MPRGCGLLRSSQPDRRSVRCPRSRESTSPTSTITASSRTGTRTSTATTIQFITIREDVDSTPLLKGLPNDSCTCPHWGYVFKGRLVFRIDGREEVYEAGDAFYLPPGHIQSAEAGTEYLQFSPAEELHGGLRDDEEEHAGDADRLSGSLRPETLVPGKARHLARAPNGAWLKPGTEARAPPTQVPGLSQAPEVLPRDAGAGMSQAPRLGLQRRCLAKARHRGSASPTQVPGLSQAPEVLPDAGGRHEPATRGSCGEALQLVTP